MKVTKSGFLESKGFFYPPYPRDQVIKMLKYKSNGLAIDIGAGFGNNTTLLLESGFKVIATETNPECIEALKKMAVKYPSQLEIIDTPLERLSFERQFDAVICTMVLHFLKTEDALASIRHMKAWTRVGGINVITGYTKNNPDMGEHLTFLLEKDELKECYVDWEILLYEEVSSGTKNPSGKSYQSAKLIAKKL